MKGKKFFKKGVAFACAATMLASSATVFAATTATGSSAVENDNSTAPTFFNVVLPTITANTYDYIIDTEDLLSQFGDSSKYDGSSNVYFSAVESGKEATAVAVNSSNNFYTLEKQEDTGAATIIAELVNTTTPAALPGSFSEKYYVWQPDRTDADTIAAGAGTWTEVTPANVDKFMTLTENASNEITNAELRTDNKYGSDIWDGKIYVEKYVAVTDPKEVAKYFTLDENDAVTVAKTGLYVGDGTTANTQAVAASDVTYTPATFWNVNTSQPATVINQSTTPVVVTATVSLPDNNGLDFKSSTTFTGVTTAALCMSFNDGANDTFVETAADGKTEATAYFLLQGANLTSIKYQGTDIDDKTGSHNYYQYVPVSSPSDYESVTFTLKAVANDAAGAKDAWAAYIADLKSGKVDKPDITVVYDFDKVELDPDDTNNKTYVGENGTYTIATANTSGKATLTTPAAPTFTKAYGYFDSDWNLWLAIDNDEEDGGIADESKLSNVVIGDTDGTAGAPSAPSDYTVEYGWIKIAWDDLADCVTDGDTWNYTATFTYDGVNYTRTVTELTTGPDSE